MFLVNCVAAFFSIEKYDKILDRSTNPQGTLVAYTTGFCSSKGIQLSVMCQVHINSWVGPKLLSLTEVSAFYGVKYRLDRRGKCLSA